MATKTVGSLKSSDVEVTIDDQNKINKFARLNQRLEEVRLILKRKKKNVQDLNDALDEILLQADDVADVSLMIGEAFISYTAEDSQNEMEKLKSECETEVSALMKREEAIKEEMAKLKIDLYAKFGSSINLEADEDA